MRLELHEILFAVVGGAVVAVAATLNLYCFGRLINLPALPRDILTCKKNCTASLSFFTGLCVFVYLLRFTDGYFNINNTRYNYIDPRLAFVSYISLIGMILGGFFLGFGAGLASGCPGTHIVGGVPRCSKRSLVFLGIMGGVSFLAATLRYHLEIMLTHNYHFGKDFYDIWKLLGLVGLVVLVVLSVIRIVRDIRAGGDTKWAGLISLGLGGLFAMGLMFAGLLRPTYVQNYITINKNWNPSLAFMVLTVVLLNFCSYRYIIKTKQKPVFGDELHIPDESKIDVKLIVGSVFVGLGWGMSLLDQAPAYANFFLHPELMIFVPVMVISYLFTNWLVAKVSKKPVEGDE